MLSHCLRRADSADRTSHLIPILGLILLLAAPAARADEPDSEEEAEPAPPSAVVASDEADEPPPAHQVGPVTVTATRAERDVLDVAGNVTVIDRQEIERSGAETLPDLLRSQPGLFVTNSTSNLAGFNVDARGFNNGGGNGANMLVQVNGRRVNEPDSNWPDWALIPPDEIEFIEIVRGPTSAIYGDAAVGGVINIRTRPAEGPLRATLRGRVGRYQSGGGSLLAAGSAGSLTGSIFAAGLTTDGYRDQSAFSNRDFNGSLEWNLRDRALLGIRGGYHSDTRELPGPLTQEQIDDFGRRAAKPDNLGDESETDSAFVHGWLKTLMAEDIELQIQPYYRPRSDSATYASLKYGDTTVESDKMSVGVDAQLRIDRPLFGLDNRLIVGGEFLHEEANRASDSEDTWGICSQPRTTTFSDVEREIFAAFVQDELRVTEGLLITAGVRFDRARLDLFAFNEDPVCGRAGAIDAVYHVPSPKASITYRILPALSVYGSYARGFRIPSMDEASPVVFAGWLELPDLDAQISDAGEVGVKYRSERIEASLALYLMGVRNEILLNPYPDEYGNTNLDLVRHAGIETSIRLWLLEWLLAYANYTFDDVKILEADTPAMDGARMPITPRHRGTLGLQAKFPYELEFTANANFVDERILANDFDRQLPPLDAYATLDLLMAWRPKLGEKIEGALTLALRNVADEQYEDYGARYDVFAFPESIPTAFFSPAATRTWEVGFMLTLRR
jgi:iron complex outermembrane receptor protein